MARHARGNDTGINAAAEEHAQWHIAHQTQAHGFVEQVFKLCLVSRIIPVGLPLVKLPIPIRLHVDRRAVPGQPVARHEFADTLKERCLATGVAKRQKFRQHVVVDLWRAQAAGQQRFNLGGKVKHSVVHRVVEGFDAQSVPRHKQALPALVPDGKGPHAAQAVHAIHAVLFIGVDNGFRIALGAVAMPLGFERGAQFLVIVDLAVVRDPYVIGLIGHRLVATAEINDAQPPVPQSGPQPPARRREIDSPVIRPPVRQHIGHDLQALPHLRHLTTAHQPCDPTHIESSVTTSVLRARQTTHP